MPRLIARSMLSFGIDASRAFWTIVRSVGFASTSPPPARAATSIWRASRAKSLPRAASAAPFCVLDRVPLGMAAHAITSLDELLRNRWWSRRSPDELGMERRRPDRALRGTSTGRPSCSASTSTVGTDRLDDRRADEHAGERAARRGRRRRAAASNESRWRP